MGQLPTDEFTKILNQASQGDAAAKAKLLNEIYGELKAMATSKVAQEKENVESTLLVHEVFLKLFGGKKADWNSRAHFFGAAAEAMRRVLVDLARERNTLKRGGDRLRVTLSESLFHDKTLTSQGEFLDLNHAIEQLQADDQGLAEIVKLRFFAGQTMESIAEVLDVSLSSVERKWRLARAYLIDQMSQ